MFEKRVFRGNTHSSHLVPNESSKSSVALRQSRAPGKLTEQKMRQPDGRSDFGNGFGAFNYENVHTPRALEGREHTGTNTDKMIEDLTSKALCFEQEAQTEFKIDRPPDLSFVPKKTGIDRETQIYEGELFDFSSEVEPILEVLCGRVLEQSRMEVLEEEELRIMKQQQKAFEMHKTAELAEVQRLEMHERRLKEEKERRETQYKAVKEMGVFSHKRLISRLLGKNFTKKLTDSAMRRLMDQGYFRDRFTIELEANFTGKISQSILGIDEKKLILNASIEEALETIENSVLDLHRESLTNQRRKREAKKEEEEKQKIRKEERKAKRAEEKIKSQEESRIQKLREEIITKIISKGENKDDFYQQALSDLDSLGGDSPSIGLVGGLVLEIAEMLSVVVQLQEQSEEKLAGLKKVPITPQFIGKLIESFLNDFIETGKVEIGISEDTAKKLAEIGTELKLEAITQADPANKQAIISVLKENIRTFVVSLLEEELEELGIQRKILNLVLEQIAALIVTENNFAKFRLVVPKDTIKQKAVAYVRLKPLIEEEPKGNPIHKCSASLN